MEHHKIVGLPAAKSSPGLVHFSLQFQDQTDRIFGNLGLPMNIYMNIYDILEKLETVSWKHLSIFGSIPKIHP
jgi:hypothetical protein